MKWRRRIQFAALAVLGVWGWMVLHPSPERLIRRELEAVAHAVSFEANEGNLAKLASAERVAGFFSTNVDVQLEIAGRPERRITGREEIQEAAVAARGAVRGLNVKFVDVTVALNADELAAVADLTAEARVDGEADVIVEQMKFSLRKIEGEWLIVKVETVRMLQ